MTVEMTRDEAALLIVALKHLENEFEGTDAPMAGALRDLRPYRSRLLEVWLRDGLKLDPIEQ